MLAGSIPRLTQYGKSCDMCRCGGTLDDRLCRTERDRNYYRGNSLH